MLGLHPLIYTKNVFHVKPHENFQPKIVVSRETSGAENLLLRKME